MNIFKIDDTDFGIGKVIFTSSYERGTISVVIEADKERYFQEVAPNEDSPWAWGGHPPRLNLRELPSNDGTVAVEITEEIYEDDEKYPNVYDISLVFYEHYDIYGTLVINDNYIIVKGTVDFQGDIRSLEMVADKPK